MEPAPQMAQVEVEAEDWEIVVNPAMSKTLEIR